MDTYRIVLLAHIAAGTLALLAYWGAAIARKGGLLHRRIGQAYLSAMSVVLATSVALAGFFFARGQPGIGTFLAYLVVITGTACWQAWRAVRTKRDRRVFYGRDYLLLAWANLGTGVLTLGVGIAIDQVVLLVACWIGILAGGFALRRYRQEARQAAAGQAPRDPKWWMREHVQSNLGNGVATHVAFFAIGLGRVLEPLGIEVPQLVPWLVPIASALAAAAWLERKYGFGRPKPAALVSASLRTAPDR